MMETSSEWLKRRQIRFAPGRSEQNQALAAEELLAAVEAVREVAATSELALSVVYDLSEINLRDIEAALLELGFELDNSLPVRAKRALWYFAEDTQRLNASEDPRRDNPANAWEVFVNRYQSQRHGCRDRRPRHWREYL